MTKRLRSGVLPSAALLVAQLGFATERAGEAAQKRLEREVRRELVTLPFSSLFDHLKSDAENGVKGIEGVEPVVNEVEVLPVFAADDDLVSNEMEKSIAGVQANSVAGAFSVTNNLRVEGKR